MPRLTRVYIGIGSNLGQPQAQVSQSLIALQSLANHNQVNVSPLYRTRPMGPQNQPDYVNAVATFMTSLSAMELLHSLQAIENQQGRLRTNERWGPRTLDLDLLVYGDEIIDGDRLQVPHPGISERIFVLAPLFDIEPDLWVPGQGAVKDLLAQHDADQIERIHADT